MARVERPLTFQRICFVLMGRWRGSMVMAIPVVVALVLLSVANGAERTRESSPRASSLLAVRLVNSSQISKPSYERGEPGSVTAHLPGSAATAVRLQASPSVGPTCNRASSHTLFPHTLPRAPPASHLL
jgi:hypothetical protein